MIKAQRMDPNRIPAPPASGQRVVLSLGSNLGDREATLRAAISDVLALGGVGPLAASGLVQTPALKLTGVDTEAPAYLNAILVVTCTLAPEALLDALNTIEAEHGRVREERWGDRTLDIDIVSVTDATGVVLQQDTPRLSLPHPRAGERAFVLAPWLQVEPDARLPGLGDVATLLATIANDARPYPAEALL
jgi:2-amino-4-hydroxy-6-hydroxymethyldihydropteridine diphosphokinase